MWRALRLLAVLVASAAGIAWLADRPGAVTLDWGAYRIETSAAILVASVALIALVVALIYRAVLFFRRAPGAFRVAWRARRRNRGLQALTRGMVAVAAGDPQEARRQARRAENLLQDPPLTLLLSAQAAQLAGDDGAAERFFRAMTNNLETEFLGLRGLLNQALRRGDRDEALILVRRAYRLKPDSDWVSAGLFDLQTRSGRWADARLTSREAVRHRHLSAPDGQRREAVLACQLALEAEQVGDMATAFRHAKAALDMDDALMPAATVQARVLLAEGKHRKAARTIEKIWPKAPHGDLVPLYIRARKADHALACVKLVERLAGLNRDHPESRIARAAAALDAHLWGEARRHLERSLADNPTPGSRLCRLMARLEEAEHNDLAKARDWLVRAATADPDPSWICRHCGHVARVWAALCDCCQTFDGYRWRVPPHTEQPVAAVALPGGDAGKSRPATLPTGTAPADGASGKQPEAGNHPALPPTGT